MDELIKQYNNIWTEYMKWQKKFFSENWDLPLKYIENIISQFNWKKILDLWCWDWHDIVYFKEKYNNEYFWIDASEVMINSWKENFSLWNEFCIWNFENLPFDDDTFDIVYAKYSFSYLVDFEKVYKEVKRCLKKSWVFVFIQNHPINDFSKKRERYPIKETLNTQLFSTQTEITYYSHTLWEILSRLFLENFMLIDFTEDYMFRVLYPIPVFIWVTAIKK